MLSAEDFPAFFHEVQGCAPFPWQARLLRRVAERGAWPDVLDLPTGSGKTAALDIAVFHLALEAGRGETRRAPVRIALVVDRRLVVDDAYMRARRLQDALAAPPGPVTARVADSLRTLSGDGPPLVARRLRGGIPREDDWARTPSQPTLLCSTVDQVGSRLLFRGYGVSDAMKPVHAGLIGSDCLILLDEAHLAEPFRQTLDWVRVYRGPNWRRTDLASPWAVALLTATPGETRPDAFALDDADRSHPVLRRRLAASKPARLVESRARTAGGDDAGRHGEQDLADRAAAISDRVRDALEHFHQAANGAPVPAIGVVVNRVARARAVFRALTDRYRRADADCLLLIGPARPVDRDGLATRLAPVRTGADRDLDRPLLVVATQCIEAGVDIDLDALVTEAAPLDSLRQRFGRLNRAGRDIRPYAAVTAVRSDLSARADDPVYGTALKAAWERLRAVAVKDGGDAVVEFGPDGFAADMDAGALARKADAPVLMPAHLDLLSQTSPIPAADPDVSLYLHGHARQPDSISVVWRADIDPEAHRDDDVRRLLTLVPPRSREAVELPLWAVRRWLSRAGAAPAHLADIATPAPADEPPPDPDARRVFRWAGNDDRSRWIDRAALRPGDTVIAPARHGGVDAFGWNPARREPATDVGRQAAAPFAGRRFAVRVAPGLLGDAVDDGMLADALAGAESRRWTDLRAALAALDLPDGVRDDLARLDKARNRRGVTACLDLYGTDAGRPRGVVFLAPFGIDGGGREEDGRPNATEDDASGSIAGFPLSLRQHGLDVERKAEDFAAAAGLPAGPAADLKLAGYLHDLGKADPRFQAWLHHGDPLGADPDDAETVLAKSGRLLPPAARAAAGLPANWRHEAFSVRLAPHVARFGQANDPELVLWLVGVHHGHGRPFFPHRDPDDAAPRHLPGGLGLPAELPPGPGPQSLAYDRFGFDWPMLFARLKARYGAWELARLEAVLRLADHRASENRTGEAGP